jgi:hypothetical protein
VEHDTNTSEADRDVALLVFRCRRTIDGRYLSLASDYSRGAARHRIPVAIAVQYVPFHLQSTSVALLSLPPESREQYSCDRLCISKTKDVVELWGRSILDRQLTLKTRDIIAIGPSLPLGASANAEFPLSTHKHSPCKTFGYHAAEQT